MPQTGTDCSTMSRRTFTGLGLALMASSAAGQTPRLRLLKIHAFELRVRDLGLSIDFYQRMFGMPVQARTADRACLRIGTGPQFMSLRALQDDEKPAITHISYSVSDFSVAGAQRALVAAGFDRSDDPGATAAGLDLAERFWTSDALGSPQIYFADPRGLIVQLCDSRWCGAARCRVEASAADGVFELKDINHLTVFVNDGAEANRYYQSMFDLSVQAYQGAGAPVTGIGDGFQFVMYAGPPREQPTPALIHHGCFSMNGFDVDAVRDKLTEIGLTPRGERETGPLMHYVSLRMPERGGAEGGTPELYFTDPDGILMQLQDVSYCGGGGYLGEVCDAA